ncbi:BTAD domain-containing putative transcriptional regulator [Cellulomonas chitinilytica]|uniref:BTAD domain-containing putative transcriptional regulator n=1 Tax=Cellulomonas chitinilytica TaxID=398759 RepID=UPI001EF266ED|nr:BTAD domain-containing putative transcriptional regulator [Cellulomonas chitinilytica]
MQITTLGTLAVDGRAVRGDRLVAVVRALLDARGRAVSSAALVEDVWEGDPPDDATGAVQALVSRARRLGLAVAAAPGGYRLPTDGLEVDTDEVAALVARARSALRSDDPTAARALAGEARALVPLVPDLTDAATARLLADVAAVRAEAGLALGDTTGTVDDLRAVALRTPPDEPLVALLVRVLAAQGRDAEAVEVVDHLRTDLAERYGTDPSPVVAQAHLALLRGELAPSPAPTRPAPPAAPRATVALPVSWRRPATVLVGRDADVVAVETALKEAPLVTVMATGGAGKTRLATEVARRAAALGTSVRAVELAGVHDPAEVLPAVLAALGGAETAAAGPDIAIGRRLLAPEERLRFAAQDLDGLVVLDNCEHVLDAAAAVVTDLLAAAPPDVVVLATSRAPLGIVGEVVHRLRALPDDDALALLESRARAGRDTVGWDQERARELCHRLDNLPLALELAAARLRAMPVDDVLDGLSDRFALLDDALRGLPERHASLWAMVDWSRELLDPPDRDLLERLAVIPAPFTADTALAVSGQEDRRVRRGLAMLVEQSLLTLDESDEGPARYRMLETVREYGTARLDAVGGRPAAMEGLVRWSAAECVLLRDDFIGHGQIAAFTRCAAEQDTFLAALRWAVAHDDEPPAVDITAALFQLWTIRGLHLEVVAWSTQLFHVDSPAARRTSALVRGRAAGRPLPHGDRLVATCLFATVNAGAIESVRLMALAWRGARQVLAERPDEVEPRMATLVATLPGLSWTRMEDVEALPLIDSDDPYLQGLGLFLRAAIRENTGEAEFSASDAMEAYHRFEQIGDHWGMGMAAQGVGQWDGQRGAADAELWLRRGIEHLELVGAMQDARSARVLLDVQRALGGDQEAVRVLQEVVDSPADPVDVAQALLGLAHVAWRNGRFDDAVHHADAAAAVVDEEASMPIPQARSVFRVATAVVHLGVADQVPARSRDARERARQLLRLALPDADATTDMPVLGSVALGGAELAAREGRDDEARELWALGIRLGANLAAMLRMELGDSLAATLGDVEEQAAAVAALRARPAVTLGPRIRELLAGVLAD